MYEEFKTLALEDGSAGYRSALYYHSVLVNSVVPLGMDWSVCSGITVMGWRKNSVQALSRISKKKHLRITTQVCVYVLGFFFGGFMCTC